MRFKSFFLTSISLWLMLVLSQNSIAQSSTTSFFKDYYKVGLQGYYAKIAKGEVLKNDPTINYSIEPFGTGQFGVMVNVYQAKHWNFKTGFLFKYMVIRETLLFTKEQTGLDFEVYRDITFGVDNNIKSIPLHAEYIMKLGDKFNISLLMGGSVGWWKDYGGGGGHGIGNGIDPVTMLVLEYHAKDDTPIYTSAEIGLGFYIPTKHILVHTQFIYSKSFKDILVGSYEATGYQTVPHSSTGTFTQSGDYWAVGLSFYIKKRGKNKKR